MNKRLGNAPVLLDTTFLIYSPVKTENRTETIQLPKFPGVHLLFKVIKPWIGFGCQHIEHVSVLFDGKHHDLFVDETGAISTTQRGILPVNEEATKIYHAYGISKGHNMKGAARIHGVAVLAKRKVWS